MEKSACFFRANRLTQTVGFFLLREKRKNHKECAWSRGGYLHNAGGNIPNKYHWKTAGFAG